MNKTVHITYCSDKICLRPMVASAISAIRNLNSKCQAHIHLLYRNIELSALIELQDFFWKKFQAKFDFYAVPKKLAKKFNNKKCPQKYISDAMFDRLFIHKLIPKLNKTIYIDADTIVTGDLSELYYTDLNDNYIGAVIEPPFEFDEKTHGYDAIRHMKLDIDTFYFNSGVLLMDLNKLRKINFIKKCQNYFNKYINNIVWPDQDILNGVLGEKTLFIAPKFNSSVYDNIMTSQDYYEYLEFYGKSLCYSDDEVQTSINQPVILHYVGAYKPWIHPGKYSLHKDQYWKYYNMSPWKTKDSTTIEKILLNKKNAGGCHVA
ncbi:MAG: glycosyltransferase family 8 protein [Gammaproteobacteria bacterium]